MKKNTIQKIVEQKAHKNGIRISHICAWGTSKLAYDGSGNVKHKQRDEQEKKALMTRLSRIEGQVRGIKGMVEKDAYCTDILVQVAAVNAALNSFNKVLLANHIKTCVTRDIREGKEETVDELVAVLQKLMK